MPPVDRRALHRFAPAIALLLASGCSLCYRENRTGSDFILYSDRGGAYLDSVEADVEAIYSAYVELFRVDRRDLGTTRILLDGRSDGVTDTRYTPSLLGYYVPFFNVIRIDTDPIVSDRPDGLRQVLLHEISHHFLVTKMPDAARHCWLNEGLAGCLEMSLFDGSRREFPLLHPVLARIAMRALCEENPAASVRALIGLEWKEFHESPHKVAHYALSWSLVHYLLRHPRNHGLPLAERIARLHPFDPEALGREEDGWRDFLIRFDLTDELIRLARSRDPAEALSSRWALRQLGELGTIDDERAFRALTDSFADPDAGKRETAYRSYLQLIDRSPDLDLATPEGVLTGLERIAVVLADDAQPAELRVKLVDGLDATTPLRQRWIEILVPLLEADDAELRRAAASALARVGSKRTIVNPEFWRHAPLTVREREVGEWKAWLDARAHEEI